ncbi:MAG: transporter [Planctomycetota bacterium]|jgi:hypothetical protein
MMVVHDKSKISFLVLLLAYALAPGSCLTAEAADLGTDRPDQTEASSTIPRGYAQLETGWLHSRDDDADVQTDVVPQSLLRYGLAGNLELRLNYAGYFREDAAADSEGSGDLAVGAKVKFWNENGWRPETAIITHLAMPSGKTPFSSERFDPDYRLAFTHTLSDRVSLAYNLGQAWKSEVDSTGDRDTRPDFQYTAALGIGLTDWLGCFVEFFGDIPTANANGPANSFDGGLTYMMTENLQLDVYSGVGLSDGADDWFIGAGFSVRFP